ncbi:uncharacterized protein [Gossypium hirsutum]|uniref:Uncharacterized protein n=1 Tax=Gossypium hirsutum TaxID=3635 RepID=A0ABM2YWE6_GOSHI|nr:uncharacterized protein LOC107917677 [Gossypium hirsutum]
METEWQSAIFQSTIQAPIFKGFGAAVLGFSTPFRPFIHHFTIVVSEWQRCSLFPSKLGLSAHFHSEIPISNSDFVGGNKDFDGASRLGGTEERGDVRRRPCEEPLVGTQLSGLFQKFLVLSVAVLLFRCIGPRVWAIRIRF